VKKKISPCGEGGGGGGGGCKVRLLKYRQNLAEEAGYPVT